jgi:uncharacterized repeat protein (TIGR02543 family)
MNQNISTGYTILLVIFISSFFTVFSGKATAQEVTGLSDWTLFIDQGHSQTENMGLYGYSEAEKVLRVGLALRDFFFDETDIDTVYLARHTDSDQISLEARVALANTLGVDFYYSIHSDAGPSHVNSTLMLYGGWKSNGVLVEKTPEGGADYGEILDWDLTGTMRIDRRGNYADRVFYQGDVYHHENQWPYLYVNRVTTMASLLSEAGFHTNPTQQMRNMNAEWKVLEALSAYRSFLEWHDINRPAIGVATGIISDIETELPLNDVTVTIGDQQYITDGYESLFYQYSNDPDQLRNGFYFFQDLTPGETVEVTFEKEGYQTLVADLPIVSNPNGLTEENLSFLDPQMVSFIPPVVTEVQPEDEQDNLIPGTSLLITFSRIMNQESVEEAFSIQPEAEVIFSWNDDFTLNINTSQLEYLQNYTLTLDGSIAKNLLTEQFLDGDGDGEEGGDFQLEITMSDEDTDPPAIIEQWPSENSPAYEQRPVIRLVYDEEIMEESIGENAITVTGTYADIAIPGIVHHTVVNEKSVLHFFPTGNMASGLAYTVTVEGGLSDMFDNATETYQFQFFVIDQPVTQTIVIDDFNDGIVSWWHPDQAGQTVGIIPELTSRTHNNDVVNYSVESTGSMKLNYGWDMGSGAHYIRLYLPPTAPQNGIRFNIDDVLQMYVFGDGSDNELRMVIRDGANQLESHEWITVDWTGWKLVSWDLSNEEVFGVFGLGDGQLDGANFYMDGFHLRKPEDAVTVGALYFDHLHFVQREEIQYPTTLFENWEIYYDFTTDIFPWITIDVDGDDTWNPSGFTFPGSGEPYAFKVLNPAETTPPIDDDHPPVDGSKYLIAMMSQALDENKWLISPQLLATETSELSFFARSIEVATYGPERFRVYISTDDNTTFEFDPENFTMISEGDYVEAPVDWTEYNYYLGGYAGEVIRFAIQYVSHDDYMLMLDRFEVAAAETFLLTLDANPEEGGDVSGEGEFAAGQEVQVIATPATGWAFDSWTDDDGNEVSTQATYTFNMPENDLNLTASFSQVAYDLTLLVDPEDAGTTQGEGSYFYNDEVTVTAFPATGYVFENWTDRDLVVMSTDVQYTFSMPSLNYQLTANFILETDIADLDEEFIKVYPNPSKNNLYISSPEIISFARLMDMSGRVVYAGKQQNNELMINTGDLDDGFYILQLHLEDRIYNTRIQILK